MNEIKGILIDFGNVLGNSVTGYWYLSPHFLEIVGEDNFNAIPHKRRKQVFANAWKYVGSIKTVETLEEEYLTFKKYISTLADGFPTLPIRENLDKLTYDMVYNYKKYIYFDDTYTVLPSLAEKYKICLVSDAWPSLREVFKEYGLDKYFDDMVISSEISTLKPDKKMYLTALEKLDLKPQDVIFIDDNVENCRGAAKLGIKSYVLERRWKHRIYDRIVKKSEFKIVKDMNELEKELSR